MTKEAFLSHLTSLYRAANRSDSDDKTPEERWMHPDMAGPMCCRLLDSMMHQMADQGVLTADECQSVLDSI